MSDEHFLDTFVDSLIELANEIKGNEEERENWTISNILSFIVQTRSTAKERKDWYTADKIRDKLSGLSCTVRDTRHSIRIDTEVPSYMEAAHGVLEVPNCGYILWSINGHLPDIIAVGQPPNLKRVRGFNYTLDTTLCPTKGAESPDWARRFGKE